jgi:N-acetylneuraminate lyase
MRQRGSIELAAIEGILPALLTPMDDTGTAVNHQSLRMLVDMQIERGVSGFFVCGGTGEGLLLSPDERRAVIETVVECVAGRAKVIAHIGTLDTQTACSLAAHAARLGVDAVSAVPPVYFRVDIDALCEHYRAIADAADGLPLYPYHIPSATGVEISAQVMRKLMEIPAVRGIKYSSYNLYDMHNIIELDPERLTVLSGFDEVCVAALSMGAHGAIGTTYNVMPATFNALYRAMQAGNLVRAQELQVRANRVIAALLSAPLIPALKAVLTDLGYSCGSARPPQPALSADQRQRVIASVRAAGLEALEAECRDAPLRV